MASCDWFNLMMSIPLKQPMTKAAQFTQWSAVLCYEILGLILIVWPQVWQKFFQLDFSGRTEGYFQLQAVAQLELGFLYVIFARSKFDVPGGLPIRGPVLSKIIFVTSFTVPQYLKGSLTLIYIVFYITLDTVIALTSFVIWYCEAKDASIMKLFRDMIKFMFSGLPKRKSSVVVKICGVIQAVISFAILIKPQFIRQTLSLDSFQGNAVGFLSAYFFLLLVHGTLAVTGGTADGISFNIACAFYRLVIGIPSLAALVAGGQIEVSLALFAASFDFVFAVIISVTLLLEGRTTGEDARKKS